MVFSKKIALFALVFLAYMSIAYAASFDVNVVPVNDRILIEEVAKFRLEIKNNLEQSDEYRIYTLDFPTWDMRTEPMLNPITLELRANSNGSVEVLVDPLRVRDVGSYAVNVNVRSKVTNKFVSVPLRVTILSTESLIQGYVPTVITNLGISKEIDPREAIPIKIVLNNQNIIDYPDLVVNLESNLIKETINTKLGPKEEKTLEITANIDPLTAPQKDRLVVSVFKGNRSIINPVVRTIEIAEYAEQKLVNEKKKFLLTKKYYNLVSNNKDYEGTFKVETTLFDSIVSSTKPKAKSVKEDDKRYFVWDVVLEDNVMEVVVTKNFIPLFVAIAILIVLVVSYYTLRAPLFIVKEASNIVKSEGGISEMTVILRTKNRSPNKIGEIEVTEFVPALVSVGKEVPIGSLQPTKVLKHEEKGSTMIKWVVDTLNPSEERVLSYRIKSKLSILGSLTLPPTKAAFKYNNKTITSTSNTLSVQ